mmetsp:Transcript_7205/g.10718  ORF Transcript_7205/g.10718 Transcript_7205/m.10718 type:complete len:220 (+) Transcript_7205:81-740(+)
MSLKRKAINQLQPLNNKNTNNREDRKILVILPGASGKLSKCMIDKLIPLLRNHYEVRILESKWKGWNPMSSSNIQKVLDICPSEGVWYVLGNSFGCRVACSLYSSNSFVCPPAKVILCGYPMYGPKGTEERVECIQSLPEGTEVLCISGSKDEFLGRGPDRKLTGKSLYEHVIRGMPCRETTRVHILDGGGHGVLDVPSKLQSEAVNTVLQWIVNFTQE